MEAFAPIVRRWQRPLLNLAYRFCRNRAEAEEMVQEAFLRVYRKLHLYREDAAFSTWMFSVAVRLFTSHMRRRRPPGLPLAAFDRMPGEEPAALAIERRDRDEAVRRAVGTLPPRYQEAINLYYFLERDVEESARILGLSTGTFKSRLHRGRNMLRKKIGTLLGVRPAVAEV